MRGTFLVDEQKIQGGTLVCCFDPNRFESRVPGLANLDRSFRAERTQAYRDRRAADAQAPHGTPVAVATATRDLYDIRRLRREREGIGSRPPVANRSLEVRKDPGSDTDAQERSAIEQSLAERRKHAILDVHVEMRRASLERDRY